VALKPELLETTAALIMIDLDQPWDMKEQLFKWMRLLEEIVKDVLNKLSLEKKTSLQKRIERYIKRYNKLDEVKVEKEDSQGKKGPVKGR
jgi:hypothetical protein